MVLKNLERGLRSKFDELSPSRRWFLDHLIALNRVLTRRRSHVGISRLLLPQIHRAFGGSLKAMFVGGAFMEPSTLQFFYDLGVPVSNGYGLTEASTVLTLNDGKPFRADTVGKPLAGVELRILNPDSDNIGEVAARSKTVMSHYLNAPELTAATIVDGWLLTGDLGRFDPAGHLQLFGRRKNMIVTEGGKNIYPEDVENAFDGLSVKEYCIFATNFLWPMNGLGREQLVMAIRLEPGAEMTSALQEDLAARNRRLPDFKRLGGYFVVNKDFPRTASMKIKRIQLGEEIGKTLDRAAVVAL
jgi:long-chain acyl-CoA synthetase